MGLTKFVFRIRPEIHGTRRFFHVSLILFLFVSVAFNLCKSRENVFQVLPGLFAVVCNG